VCHCFAEAVRADSRGVCVLQSSPDGTLKFADRLDAFVGTEHFNTIPFRDIASNSIIWVQEENGPILGGLQSPGTGPFFGEKTPFAKKRLAENMDLSPSARTLQFSWGRY